MTVKVSREWYPDQKGGDLVVEALGHWVRFAVYVGTPPGSHIGIWRTSWGDLKGLNVRVGKRYIGPCLTAFVHTHRSWTRVGTNEGLPPRTP